MRILTYKRTHVGDPDERGQFGIYNCMGRVRGYRYDAVIGVGGNGKEAHSHDIAGKITWVGIERMNEKRDNHAGSIEFCHFVLLDKQGPLLSDMAPALAKRLRQGARFILSSYSHEEKKEAESIISWARNIPRTQVSDDVINLPQAGPKSERNICKSVCKRRMKINPPPPPTVSAPADKSHTE